MDFDDTKSFDDNLDDFLAYIKESDPEMGQILNDNISALKDVSDDASRRRARAEFNLNVVKALGGLAKESDDA